MSRNCFPNSPLGSDLSPEEMTRIARRFCREVQAAESCSQALDLALEGLQPEDALIVCGSFYLAGELRPLLLEKFSAR